MKPNWYLHVSTVHPKQDHVCLCCSKVMDIECKLWITLLLVLQESLHWKKITKCFMNTAGGIKRYYKIFLLSITIFYLMNKARSKFCSLAIINFSIFYKSPYRNKLRRNTMQNLENILLQVPKLI